MSKASKSPLIHKFMVPFVVVYVEKRRANFFSDRMKNKAIFIKNSSPQAISCLHKKCENFKKNLTSSLEVFANIPANDKR